MDPERWRQIESLYHDALEHPPAGRDAYLRQACGGDESVRAEVEELLGYQPGSFMETPAMHMVARREGSAEFHLGAGSHLGPYEILHAVGAGGMGEVYSARDTRLGRIVALKLLASEMRHSGGFGRLEREARAISSLNHPNICTLFDIGRDDEIDYLVMEFVEGATLAARLQQGPLSLNETLRVALEIGGALEYAHRHGVIHRDLKPGNIMLTPRGAKLVDFGLARLPHQADELSVGTPVGRQASLSMTGLVAGTPQYMAPEQIARGEVDARTDVFAFGAVMFEMVHGRKAFTGDTPTEVVAAIRRGAAPVSRSQSAGSLNRVIQRCLKTAPSERWQSASEVLRELQRIERRNRSRSRLIRAGVTALCLALAAGLASLARNLGRRPRAKLEVLYSFTGKNGDGASPERDGVAVDKTGTLYGFTRKGGASGQGTVYKLTTSASRGAEWREHVIYSFSGTDGAMPLGEPVFGRDGSLYGTTMAGGRAGHGVVFRLTAPARPGEPWIETVIHHFVPATRDGASPLSGLTVGRNGFLYGTTANGGAGPGDGYGTVYELAPPSGPDREWKERVLCRFTGRNGAYPWARVVFGGDGSLYGTAFNRPGVVFKLEPTTTADAGWKETVLDRFVMEGLDGDSPVQGLTVGRGGELYGTTEWGGIAQNGVVYRLTAPEGPAGPWNKTILYRFGSHTGDGAEPSSGLLIGAAGELYGTTKKGGTWGFGIVFKLTPATRTREPWSETVLASFTGQNGDGASPEPQQFVSDRTGALCGTTRFGGAYNVGTVFRLTLPGS